MELILLQKEIIRENIDEQCFNPCFIGTYSFTEAEIELVSFDKKVLILVLLELILLQLSRRSSVSEFTMF